MDKNNDLEVIVPYVANLMLSSEFKYKSGDYKGAFLDRKKAKESISEESSFKALIKGMEFLTSKYDLIRDYKDRLDEYKKKIIINKLERISKLKLDSGDYKGAVRAIRRAEKYY